MNENVFDIHVLYCVFPDGSPSCSGYEVLIVKSFRESKLSLLSLHKAFAIIFLQSAAESKCSDIQSRPALSSLFPLSVSCCFTGPAVDSSADHRERQTFCCCESISQQSNVMIPVGWR